MPVTLRPDPAQGVFETMLVLDGSPLELDAHLERLARSVRELYGAELPAEARRLALERATGRPLGRLRLTAAPAPDGALCLEAVSASVEAADVFPSWERAVGLEPFAVNGGLGAHKWADRAALATIEGDCAVGSLPLLLDADDQILEATRANIFILEGEALITPAADGRILPGIARARAIAAARRLSIDVREEPITRERAVGAGRVFLTGSIRGIEPARSLGDSELGPPGEAIAPLVAEMRRAWLGAGQDADPAEHARAERAAPRPQPQQAA